MSSFDNKLTNIPVVVPMIGLFPDNMAIPYQAIRMSSFNAMRSPSKKDKFIVKQYFVYNTLHVLARKGHHQALQKYKSKVNRFYYRSYSRCQMSRTALILLSLLNVLKVLPSQLTIFYCLCYFDYWSFIYLLYVITIHLQILIRV